MGKGIIVLPCPWWKFLGRFLPARDRCGGWGSEGSAPIAESLHLPARRPSGTERLELSLGLFPGAWDPGPHSELTGHGSAIVVHIITFIY